MGSPDWSRIPFDKMPDWKKDEVLARASSDKKKYEALMAKTSINSIKCEVCGKLCASKLGYINHKKIHDNKEEKI